MRIDHGQRRTAGTACRAGYCGHYTGRQAKCQGTSSTPSLGKERVSCRSLRIGTEYASLTIYCKSRVPKRTIRVTTSITPSKRQKAVERLSIRVC